MIRATASVMSLFWVLALTSAGLWSGNSQLKAQSSAHLTVSANPVVLGTPFQLTIALENASGPIVQPRIAGLEFLSGPMQSNSTQITNGKKTTRRSMQYHVRAKRKGIIRILPVAIKTNRGVLKTKLLNLRVVAGGQALQQSAKQALPDLWIAVEPSKNSVYLGEPMVLKYQIYKGHNNINVRRYDLPTFDGCWKEPVADSEERWTNVVVDGQSFQTITARIVVLFPTQTGKLNINGFTVTGSKQVSFFQSTPLRAEARPVQIEVKPLPKGALAGHLGTFPGLSVAMSASESSPTAHGAFTMNVKFSGQGNLKLLAAPSIDWPSDFEVYDPETKDRITIDKNGERGSRTFEYVVIPRSAGEFEIELPTLSYFDSRKGVFVSLGKKTVKLEVAAGQTGMGATMGFQSKTDVHAVGHDIRFIRENAAFIPRSSAFFGSIPFTLLLWMGPVGLLIFAGLRRKKLRFMSDPRARRKAAAKSQLAAALKGASGAVGADMASVVHEFLLAELDLPRSDTGRSVLEGQLVDRMGEKEAAVWCGLLDELEQGEYAGAAFDMADVARRIQSAKSRWARTVSAVAVACLLMTSGALTAGQEELTQHQADSLWSTANAAYEEGLYEKAVADYEKIADQWQAFELEYNMGNAHFKMGQIGPSILHYKRAEKLRTGDADLGANLLTASAFIIDRIEPLPSLGLDNVWDAATTQGRLDVWAHLAWIFSLIASLALAMRLHSKKLSTRRAGGMSAIAAVALAVGFLLMARSTSDRISTSQEAVLTVQRTEVLSEPGGATTLFVLHEGTVVQLLEQRENWYKIRLSNGNVGWLNASDCTSI